VTLIALFCISIPASAQMITGVWKGKINRQKVEVKIIQNGDSLTGTSYYYESANHFRRYSIKGYFNHETNEAVWWDDQLIEEKAGRVALSNPGRIPMLSSADFNCPGGGKMMLDGKAGKRDDDSPPKGEVHLDKVAGPSFEDEWDYVIDNFTVGANDPDIIDSIENISGRPVVEEVVRTVPRQTTPVIPPPVEEPVVIQQKPVERPAEKPVAKIEMPKEEPRPVVKLPDPPKPLTIEEKFTSRKKVFQAEIPITGDSIELRFYDNAEIDGDSITLFMNDKLIFTHIRLTGNAYSIKFAVTDLNDSNELIMVAENLGSIPPNTSYMVALVGDQRYEARLESTEGSSAMVRFVKQAKSQ
jgi:hypothetical protein